VIKKKMPVFSVGKYNDVEFTMEDMKQIVQNFKEFYPYIQPVMKLTHSEEQLFLQILAKKYGFDVKKIEALKGERLIGLGSVKNLEFDEGKGVLYAEIDEIPEEFAEFINKTPTRRISPEFYTTNKGKVLRAISLVDIPANKNLDKIVFEEDIDKSYSMKFIDVNKLKEEIEMDEKILKLEKEKMELEKKLEKAEKKAADLDAKVKKFEEEVKAKDELIHKFEEKVREMKIEKKVDELIGNGNITADKKDLAIQALKVSKFDENAEDNPVLKLLGELKVVDTKTYSEVEAEEGEAKKKKANDGEEDNEDEILLNKYEELVKSGVDPEIATEQVYGKILN